MTQLAEALTASHVSAMAKDDSFFDNKARGTGNTRQAKTAARGPVIDQDGREIRTEPLGRTSWDDTEALSRKSSGWKSASQGSFDFNSFEFGTSSANPFGNLTREQRITRLDALAKLLDVAFIVPGTNVRYGIDGLIGLIPIVGDIITTAISLWLVREARALGAPWHVTMRMLGNVALDGAVGAVPLIGDAFDVMFRANIRNMRLLHRWLDKQR